MDAHRFFTKVILSILILISSAAFATIQNSSDLPASASTFKKLTSSIQGANAQKSPQITKTKKGYLRFIGAPRDSFFPADPTGKWMFSNPDEAADAFISQYCNLFVNPSPDVSFNKISVKSYKSKTYVRYQQTYNDIPIYNAKMMIKLNKNGGVTSVLSKIVQDIKSLDFGQFSLVSCIDASAAEKKATEWMAANYKQQQFQISEPKLFIYSISNSELKLVWLVDAMGEEDIFVKERIFVDAHNGKIVYHHSLIKPLYRVVYDCNFTTTGTLAREEGDDPCDINEVNLAYDYLGDAYDFYYSHYGRQSYDGNDANLVAKVRYDDGGTPGAWWWGDYMWLSDGYATDDVIGHEFTHGVTDSESGLDSYPGAEEPGAIAESFSDIWGELIDQSNSSGNDAPEVKWLIAEDSPDGARRNMKNPTDFNHPDRISSPYWYNDLNERNNDYAQYEYKFTHYNNGVGNKLCYLLTDGDTFNGFTISGMGINKVADLFYECQLSLVSNSDYEDLGYTIIQAAQDSNDLTEAERENVKKACVAVEIITCMKTTASGYPAGTSGEGYANWLAGGMPDCWCYEFQHLGDVDGLEQGSGMTRKRIGSVDLDLFKPCYGKKRYMINGTDCMCADLDHLDQGSGMTQKAIGSVDLDIFVANYGKKTSWLPNPVPYADDYNYWITCQGNVTYVEVHTTSDYNDNNGVGLNDCQVHFGHKDGTGDYAYPDLYLEVGIDGGNSLKIEKFTLIVCSESDSNGINVDFTETGTNTDIYRCDNPIHLSTESNQNTLELKVLNEEHISVAGVNGPEVDRGEVAIFTDDFENQPDLTSAAEETANVVARFLDKDNPNHSGDYFWWNGGEVREVNNISNFANYIKDVGIEGNLSCPADFFFECSHGDTGNIDNWDPGKPSEYTLYKPGDGDNKPTIEPNNWDKDVEWVVMYSCCILGEAASIYPPSWELGAEYDPNAYTRYWDNALLRDSNGNNCHGILSSSDILYFEVPNVLSAFFNAVQDNNITVIDAYMDAALTTTPLEEWGCAALFHSDNVDDKLNWVTQDTNDPSMYYTWYFQNVVWPGDGFPDADINDPNQWGGPYNETWEAGFGGSRFDTAKEPVIIIGQWTKVFCDIPTDQPELQKVLVRKQVPQGNLFDSKGFDKSRFDNKGRVSFKKLLHQDEPIQLTKAQAKAKANKFIQQKGGGMPADAKLTDEIRQNVMTYNAFSPENTQNTYTRKAFFKYTHRFNGIDILSDSILVGLETNQVSRFNRHWRNIVGPAGPTQTVISAREALDVVVENISQAIPFMKGKDYSVNKIKLFYYGPPSENKEQYLTPAWGFLVNNSKWVYVNAFTGEFLR